MENIVSVGKHFIYKLLPSSDFFFFFFLGGGLIEEAVWRWKSVLECLTSPSIVPFFHLGQTLEKYKWGMFLIRCQLLACTEVIEGQTEQTTLKKWQSESILKIFVIFEIFFKIFFWDFWDFSQIFKISLKNVTVFFGGDKHFSLFLIIFLSTQQTYRNVNLVFVSNNARTRLEGTLAHVDKDSNSTKTDKLVTVSEFSING